MASMRNVLAGDANLGEPSLDLSRTRGATCEFPAAGEHLLDVSAAPHQGVHHCERILEEKRDASPAQAAQLTFRHGQDVEAVEENASCRRHIRREQPSDCLCRQ